MIVDLFEMRNQAQNVQQSLKIFRWNIKETNITKTNVPLY